MSNVLLPSLVVALAAARLRDVDEALSRKLDASTVQVSLGSRGVGVAASRIGATERRVLGLARAAIEMISGPEPATVPVASSLYPGPSKFAVLGSAGFEIPAYADMFAEAPGWRAAMLRRGTPDPQLSLVEVPSAAFLKAFIDRSIVDAGGSDARRRQGAAFAMGLAGALAHAVVAGPVARTAYARRTSKPWVRSQPGAHHLTDLAAGLRLIGGPDPLQEYAGWWPGADRVADVVGTYHRALEDTYHLEARPPGAQGWPAFEHAPFVPGPALTPERSIQGYQRLVSDLTPFSMAEWFGVLTPILLAPGITMLLSGLLLPASSAFITGAPLTERSASELITLADGVNSVTPFIYSMIMWANVPDQPREPFVNALWTFILRLGLLGAWVPTIGSPTNDPSPAGRWAVAGGMMAVDVYALIRLLASLGDRQPGPSVAFGVQNVPAVMTVTTFLQAAITAGVVAIAQAAGAGATAAAVAGWITTALTSLGLWLGLGLPLAHTLAQGGGWMSWFAGDQLPTLRGALAASGGRSSFTLDVGSVFDDSTLWHDPAVAAPALADLRYPTGGRPLVKVWRAPGSPALEIAHDGHVVKIRNGASVTEVALGPGARTVEDLAKALAALDHVEAAPADAGVRYDLPWPASLLDPADELDPRPAADDPAHAAFAPLPDNPGKPYLLRHVPDAELAARMGPGPGASEFDGLRGAPQPGLADADDTVLGTAADLAVLLALGAASRLQAVNPVAPDPNIVPAAPVVAGPVGKVGQVFRNWNLDQRRANEWRAIVGGGAAREAPAPADAVLADGTRVADAMGWVPLWRAWLRVASDTTADTASATASRDTPAVRAADGTVIRPTNAQLTAGIRYLLDLPA